MSKRVEKQKWEEIDKSGWQLSGYLGVGNVNARKILRNFGASTFAVYAIIISHRNTDSNKCFPSVQTVADECGFSKSTVEKAITALYKAGLLDISSGKQGVNNNYYFPKENFYKKFEKDVFQQGTYRRSTPGFKKKKEQEEKDEGINTEQNHWEVPDDILEMI